VTEADLLREILACPDDDAPRLAYADRLDELAGRVECGRCQRDEPGWRLGIGGEPPRVQCHVCQGTGSVSDGSAERAAFIRCQIELATMHCTRHLHSSPCRHLGPGGAGGPLELCESLRRRERVLLESATGRGYHCWEWMGQAVKDHVVPDGAYWRDHVVFRRGFVHAITCTAADFLAHAAAIFAAQPVQSVELSDVTTPRPVDGERARHFFLEKDMPSPIFRLLRTQDCFGGWKRFPSREAARAALSAACVAYGRGRAGVGSLPPAA
jgi:uncharacterized protein (TIGR02996 family)